jgi:hypothetical protein
MDDWKKADIGFYAIFIALAVLVGAVALSNSGGTGGGSAPNPPVPRERFVAGPNFFACNQRQNFDRLTKYITDGDEAGFSNGYNQAAAIGLCRHLTVGDAYFVEDSTMSGLIEIRKQGETGTYWTIESALH